MADQSTYYTQHIHFKINTFNSLFICKLSVTKFEMADNFSSRLNTLTLLYGVFPRPVNIKANTPYNIIARLYYFKVVFTITTTKSTTYY